MNVFDLQAKIGLDSSDYDRGLNQAESGFSKVANGIKNGIGIIAKVTAAGFTAAAAGVAALSKQAVEAYADYEQLVGGVETLFGAQGQSLEEYAVMVGKSVDAASEEYDKLVSAQSKVLENANNAFMSAGLSANEYMETVTSFSASLISSLGGDTVKAAEYADKAIVDMSDNANKMGTSMEAIQNAYNGFAKQNYTMLDNLKLGYGGTKEEMQRLLEDAEKLSGVKYDLSSFGDIVEAIHVVQKEMHISGISAEEAAEAVKNGTMTEAEALAAMGTTAREAATTISGSVSMMKSSWQNLITGVADDTQDFDSLINNFVDSVDTVAENILPRVEKALSGVGKLVEKLVPSIMERVPSILNDTLPQLIDSASAVLKTLVDTIVSNIDGIFSTAANLTSIGIKLIDQIAEGIVNNTDAIIDGIGRIFNDLIESIGVLAPTLFDAGFQLIQKIGEGIIKYTPDLIDTATTALEDFAAYLADNASVMLPKLVKLVGDIAKMLTDPEAIGRLVDVGIDIIMTLTDAIIQALPTLVNALPEIIQNIVTAITDNLPKLLDAGWDIVKALVEAVFANLPLIIEAGGQIIDSLGTGLVQALMSLYEKRNEIYNTIADLIIEAYHFAVDAASENIGKMGKTLVKALVKVGAVLLKYIKKAKELGSKFVMNIITGFSAKLSKLKSAVSDLTTAIKNKFSEAINKAKEWGKDLIQKIVDGIKTKLAAAKQAMQDITTAIKNKFKEAIDKAIDWGKDLIQKVIDGVKAKIQAVKDSIHNVNTAIKDKFNEVITGAVDWGKNLIKNFIDNIVNKWNEMKQKFFDIKDKISEKFTEIVDGAKNWGKQTLAHFVDNIVSTWNNFRDKVQTVADKVYEIFKGLIDGARNWGIDMISEFIAGILFKQGDAEAAAIGIAAALKAVLHHTHPDEGPLKDDYTYMPDMMKMFAKGITDNAFLVTDALAKVTTPMADMLNLEPSVSSGTANAIGGTSNVYNITVQAGTISNDYDARRAAQIMSENLAILQTQQRRAIGL